ncbi:MAG TPA: SRPBCC family protein [Acidobacteriaceae bacterium]|nr:SRPBCC family protein [Acidobacteriaceae bacterium]
MLTFTTSQWVPYPVELVFAFFANPSNLPHLTPKWRQARVESMRLLPAPARPVAEDPTLRFQSPAAGVGTEVMLSMRLISGLPFRTSWLARIAEFAWNDHFEDEQLKGPFAAWRHTHRIVREEQRGEQGETGETDEARLDERRIDGTRITDELAYQMPLGPLGSMAHELFVRRQIEESFAFRQQRLLKILPVAARQAAQRQ